MSKNPCDHKKHHIGQWVYRPRIQSTARVEEGPQLVMPCCWARPPKDRLMKQSVLILLVQREIIDPTCYKMEHTTHDCHFQLQKVQWNMQIYDRVTTVWSCKGSCQHLRLSPGKPNFCQSLPLAVFQMVAGSWTNLISLFPLGFHFIFILSHLLFPVLMICIRQVR